MSKMDDSEALVSSLASSDGAATSTHASIGDHTDASLSAAGQNPEPTPAGADVEPADVKPEFYSESTVPEVIENKHTIPVGINVSSPDPLLPKRFGEQDEEVSDSDEEPPPAESNSPSTLWLA